VRELAEQEVLAQRVLAALWTDLDATVEKE
jgi:hypothetical protein